MTGAAEFALLPLSELRPHERIEESNALDLVALLRRTRVLADPIWVARGS